MHALPVQVVELILEAKTWKLTEDHFSKLELLYPAFTDILECLRDSRDLSRAKLAIIAIKDRQQLTDKLALSLGHAIQWKLTPGDLVGVRALRCPRTLVTIRNRRFQMHASRRQGKYRGF